MRTSLQYIKKQLYDSVFDKNYNYFMKNGDQNQLAFLMGFFPLDFMRDDRNKNILNTHSNNSSRLSNIFSRASDKGRLEPAFRKRFLDAFNLDFFKSMVNSSEFFLRNHDQLQFQNFIEYILNHDEELNQENHTPIKAFIQKYYGHKPSFTLACVIVWGFHMGDFDPIMDILKTFENNLKKSGVNEIKSQYLDSDLKDDSQGWADLWNLLKTTKTSPKHAEEFLNIALTYGISGQMGGIAMLTHIENSDDVNPLMYLEIGYMHSLGNNFYYESQPRSKKYVEIASLHHAGISHWAMGQYNERSQLGTNQPNFKKALNYYHNALSNGHFLSLNNIGKHYIRALHHHINKFFENDYTVDYFISESPINIKEVYDHYSKDPFFNQVLNTNNLRTQEENTKDFEKQKNLLARIDGAENQIIKHYIQVAYESYNYFYALGTIITIVEEQYKRYQHLYGDFKVDLEDEPLSDYYHEYLESLLIKYAGFQSSLAHYEYAKYLQNKSTSLDQTSYEYFYSSVFKTPSTPSRYASLYHLLILQMTPSPLQKKPMELEDLIFDLFIHHQSLMGRGGYSFIQVLKIYRDYYQSHQMVSPLKDYQKAYMAWVIEYEYNNQQDEVKTPELYGSLISFLIGH